MIISYIVTKNFSKEYKYTIWENIKKELLELIVIVHELNSMVEIHNRKEIIKEANIHWEKKLLFRVRNDE